MALTGSLKPTVAAPYPLGRSLLAGLAAGAVAAIVAALVSLPLRSPDDAFLNSASVTLAALLVGLMVGLFWWAIRGRVVPYAGVLLAVFVVAALGAILAEVLPDVQLSNAVGFIVPLAALVLGLSGLLTPLLSRASLAAILGGPVLAIVALGIGLGLAGQGDAQSGKLALPTARPANSGGATAAQTTAPAGQSQSTAISGQGATAAPAAADGTIRPQDVAGATYVVAAGESKATYTIREKLAQLPLPSNAVGSTTQLTGNVYLDGRPSQITADLTSLQSDQRQRDNFIKTNPSGPNLNRYPTAEYTVTVNLPANWRQGETVKQTVTGTMKIRGVEKPLTFTVEARMDGNTLNVLGTTDFTWADFNIPPPNIGGFVQVEDNVHLEVLLVAKRS